MWGRERVGARCESGRGVRGVEEGETVSGERRKQGKVRRDDEMAENEESDEGVQMKRDRRKLSNRGNAANGDDEMIQDKGRMIIDSRWWTVDR